MKEYIVDFELHENGRPTTWLQNAFKLTKEDSEESAFAYDIFRNYANGYWETEGTNLQVRITNIWTVEVE